MEFEYPLYAAYRDKRHLSILLVTDKPLKNTSL